MWYDISIAITAIITASILIATVGAKLLKSSIMESVDSKLEHFVPESICAQKESNIHLLIRTQSNSLIAIDKKLGKMGADIVEIKGKIISLETKVDLRNG